MFSTMNCANRSASFAPLGVSRLVAFNAKSIPGTGRNRVTNQDKPKWAVRAEKNSNEETNSLERNAEVSQFSDALVDMGAPLLNNLGFSGAAGLSVAIAVKVVGTAIAFALGLGFIAVQVLSYYGLIDVKWKVVEDNLTKVLDVTGDGKVDKEDAKIILDKGLGLLSQGVPSVAGFCIGFILGIKIF